MTAVLHGHDRAVVAFSTAMAHGRTAHAWLIVGPRGVGKATLAFRLARAWLAGDPASPAVSDPAQPLFRMVAAGAHPDLVVLEPRRTERGRLAEMKVETVRELTDRFYTTGALSTRRVGLVDEAELTLSRHGQNALLKLLEEPPAGVLFLIVAHRPSRLAPALRSRCTSLRLRPLSPEDLRRAVAAAAPALAEEVVTRLLPVADGSPGRLVELASGGWLEDYAALLERVAAAGAEGARLGIAELLAQIARGRGADEAATMLATLLRRALARAICDIDAVPLLPAEPALLDALAAGLSLDRLVAVWDKLAAVPGRIDGLNLDPAHAFLPIVEALATGGRPAVAGAR
jgi:DNA polymerase-3 subunit delta'